jgi:gamma-glutamylcyclotransferase (GGCT)/AIG2-like uncharacterized protein YtfP
MNPLHHPSETFRLFVYGTLMRGGCRHHLLAQQRFLGEAHTPPVYLLFDLGAYPGLVAGSPGQVVWGELYDVEHSSQLSLDRAEGAPQLFRLEPIEIEGQSTPVLAYFYQLPVPGRSRCITGRWDNQRDGQEGSKP